MIMLMIDSGMRLGECSCLLMTDIDLARRQIALRAEITKGRADRVVYFSGKTEQILRRWIQYKDRYVTTDYFFPVKSTGFHVEVHSFETNFKHYTRRAGLSEDISPHCLRSVTNRHILPIAADLTDHACVAAHRSLSLFCQALCIR